jgi:hypothetical protein
MLLSSPFLSLWSIWLQRAPLRAPPGLRHGDQGVNLEGEIRAY